MKTVLAERVSGVGWSGPALLGAPRHPDEVDEPFRETFRGLPPLPPQNWVKGRLGLGAVAVGVPLTVQPLLLLLLLPCGCGDCAGVPGLGRDEDVDGAPAGLPALSLAESLSCPDLLALF